MVDLPNCCSTRTMCRIVPRPDRTAAVPKTAEASPDRPATPAEPMENVDIHGPAANMLQEWASLFDEKEARLAIEYGCVGCGFRPRACVQGYFASERKPCCPHLHLDRDLLKAAGNSGDQVVDAVLNAILFKKGVEWEPSLKLIESELLKYVSGCGSW